MPVVLNQEQFCHPSLPIPANSSRGGLTISGNILGCYNWGQAIATGIQWAEAGTVLYILQCKGKPPPENHPVQTVNSAEAEKLTLEPESTGFKSILQPMSSGVLQELLHLSETQVPFIYLTKLK